MTAIQRIQLAWREGRADAPPAVPVNRVVIITAVALLLVATFGGDSFWWLPVFPLFVIAGVVMLFTAPVDLWLSQTTLVAWVMFGAVVISAVANTQVTEYAVVKLVIGWVVIGAMLTAQRLKAETIESAFFWAARIWPVICAVLFLVGYHRNTLGAVCVVFGAFIVTKRRWLLVAVYAGLLLWLMSRASIMGFAVAVMLGYSIPTVWWISLLAAVPLLVAIRPHSFLIRFEFWAEGLQLFRESPLFGMGPGGFLKYDSARALVELAERQIDIAQSGWFTWYPIKPYYQMHQHNIIMQIAVEYGAVGLIGAAVVAGWLVYRWQSFVLWQKTIIAGVLVAGLYDCPFFWPGVLVLVAVVSAATYE